MDTLLIAQRCVRRKLAGRCGLSSPNKPGKRSMTTSARPTASEEISFLPRSVSQAGPFSIRQYARLVGDWISSIGLDPCLFGTHSLRRTKATLIYRRTGNLRAVQLLLGHTKIESTVRYLGIEVDDALAIAEQIDV
jgi:integrase